MYRLVKYEGKDGENKLDSVAEIHSLDGVFHWPLMVGGSIGFRYYDASGKLLHSSTIEEIIDENGQIRVTTRNSVFVFEKVEEINE
jgi:hypothetical protein